MVFRGCCFIPTLTPHSSALPTRGGGPVCLQLQRLPSPRMTHISDVSLPSCSARWACPQFNSVASLNPSTCQPHPPDISGWPCVKWAEACRGRQGSGPGRTAADLLTCPAHPSAGDIWAKQEHPRFPGLSGQNPYSSVSRSLIY